MSSHADQADTLGDDLRCVLSDTGETEASLVFAAVVERLGIDTVPAEIGRFAIDRKLGAGAMGVVYLGRDAELDRRVAVKLMRPGRTSGSARQRLRQEGQALARLRHTHVVAVHEMGEYEGQPFVAMEYVEGGSLRQWMALRPRKTAEILAVLRQAGLGLSAAHEAGIVHRDFKPDNVLIDGNGDARVADFGLAARASGPTLRRDQAPTTARSISEQDTAPGAIVGTPAYMAPEIYEGEDASPASDQFGFCVTLFEALHGVRPFRGQTAIEIATAIIKGDITPPPPGRRVSRFVTTAMRRGLSRDPSARWPTMEALLAALTPGSKRWGLAIAAGGAAVATAVALGRADPCDDRGDALTEAWSDEARASLRGRFSTTLVEYGGASFDAVASALDSYATAWREVGASACRANAATQRESGDGLYALQLACLDARRKEFVDAIAILQEGDARVLRRASHLVAELTPAAACEDVDALRSRLPLPDAPDEREAVVAARADLARIRALNAIGKVDEAGAILETLQSESPPAFAPLEAEIELATASVHLRRGEVQAANASLRQSFSLAQGASDHRVAAAAAVIGMHAALSGLGDVEEARRWAWLAQPLVERTTAEPGLAAAWWMHRASIDVHEGDLAGAIEAGERARELWVEAFGPVSPQLSDTTLNLAVAHRRAGDPGKSIALLGEAERTMVAAVGEGHPELASIANSLGAAYLELERLDDAAAQFERALSLYDVGRDKPSPLGGHPLTNLGEVAARRGDHAGAIALFERARARFTPAVGPDHPWLAAVLHGRGISELALGQADRAVASLQEAHRILSEAGGQLPDGLDAALRRARALSSSR